MDFESVITFDDDDVGPSQYELDMDPRDPTFEIPTQCFADTRLPTPPTPQKIRDEVDHAPFRLTQEESANFTQPIFGGAGFGGASQIEQIDA